MTYWGIFTAKPDIAMLFHPLGIYTNQHFKLHDSYADIGCWRDYHVLHWADTKSCQDISHLYKDYLLMCHTDNCLCYVVLCVLVTCLVLSFIAFPIGIPSIEAEEVAASSLSEKMTSVLIASLPGCLPLRVIDRTHWFKGHVFRQESGTGDVLGLKLQKY